MAKGKKVSKDSDAAIDDGPGPSTVPEDPLTGVVYIGWATVHVWAREWHVTCSKMYYLTLCMLQTLATWFLWGPVTWWAEHAVLSAAATAAAAATTAAANYIWISEGGKQHVV